MRHLIYQTELSPEWEQVEKLRQVVKIALEVFHLGGELIESLSTVTAELLENGVKYGRGTHLGYRLEVTETTARVLVRSGIDPAEPALAKLEETLTAVRESAKDAYMMKQVLVSEGEEAGLGLPRIAYESHCQLEHRFDRERKHVDIEAIFDPI